MTSAQTYHPPHLIDTAPMRFFKNARAVRYEVMTQAILAFITAGHMGLVLRYSEKLLRVLRVHNRLTGANVPVFNSIIPRRSFLQGKNRWMGNQISQDEPSTVDTRSAPIVCKPNHRLAQDNKEDDKEGDRLGKGEGRLPIISLRLALPPKTYRALFEDPV